MLYDRAEKKRRGYIEKDSIVRQDGSEKLVGKDWRRRKMELCVRADGQCERYSLLKRQHHPWCVRMGSEPHHVIPRSKHRDDRLGNLVWLSHWCHMEEDPRKVKWGKR